MGELLVALFFILRAMLHLAVSLPAASAWTLRSPSVARAMV
jgi:hypothetical protein